MEITGIIYNYDHGMIEYLLFLHQCNVLIKEMWMQLERPSSTSPTRPRPSTGQTSYGLKLHIPLGKVQTLHQGWLFWSSFIPKTHPSWVLFTGLTASLKIMQVLQIERNSNTVQSPIRAQNWTLSMPSTLKCSSVATHSVLWRKGSFLHLS